MKNHHVAGKERDGDGEVDPGPRASTRSRQGQATGAVIADGVYGARLGVMRAMAS